MFIAVHQRDVVIVALGVSTRLL